MTEYIDIVFDGPPAHESGRFVEIEDAEGHGMRFGEWVEREDGFWALRIKGTGPTFPLSDRFTEGERVVVPGYSGSYPDHPKDRWGHVTKIQRDVVIRARDSLIVTFDGEDSGRAINPDVVAHGDDWRHAKHDPKENA